MWRPFYSNGSESGKETVEIISSHARRSTMEHYKGFIIFGGISRDEQGRCCSYGLV
jgi:hypothetical protein